MACMSLTLILFSVMLTSGIAQITTPEAYLGYKPGADFHLMTYEEAMGYLEKIAGESDGIQIMDMGPTSYGRRMKYAVISSEANMANLERYKEINKKLTLGKGVSMEEAEQLAEEGKAIIWIDVGLHASECSPPQHAVQLAYDVLTENNRRARLIRENVIFLLVFANPDGMTMVSEWYTKHIGTPYERSGMPKLYHKYAGHDNNRDSFIANLQETQNMNRMTCQIWYPEILYNLHETAPFPARIWIPPYSEPMNPNQHPILVRWQNLIGSNMGKGFAEAGQPGAISRVSFDSWYPGYVAQFVVGHNTPCILTETANFGYATPHYYQLRDFPDAHQELTKGVFYPNPWPGGWWRLADAVAYNLTATKSVLEVGAKYKYKFLFNKWKMATDVMDRFSKEPPYGWIISGDQADMHSVILMLNRCILNGIEVYESETSFEHNGISYPKGSWIIPTSQPFGLFLKHIFEKQEYPDLKKYRHLWQAIVGQSETGKAPIRAYDGAGWTLPIQIGAEYQPMSSVLDVKTRKVDTVVAPAGSVSGRGSHYVLSHANNASFIAVNRIFKEGGRVDAALSDFTVNGRKYTTGTFIVDAGSIPSQTIRSIASDLHVDIQGGKAQVKTTKLSHNRIALYKSWRASADAGWIRLLFDRYEFPYHLLVDSEVRAGHLKDRFDVIVLSDQGASTIINGNQKGTMPPDYVGGITMDGVDHLKKFVQAGGVLVCNKGSCELPIEHFKFPIKNVLQDVKLESFSCPGALLKVHYKTGHPLAFGQKDERYAFFSRGLAFEVITDSMIWEMKKKSLEKQGESKDKKPEIMKEIPNYVKVKPETIAVYPDESLLISGWMLGDKLIRQKAAILEVPFEKGKVVLFGFNVHNRAQSYANFKLLFNALYRN